MSLEHLAQQVRSKGRRGDTELVHFTKGEVAGLQALSQAMHGKKLSRNPDTGLVEAGSLKSLLPSIIGGVVGYYTGSPGWGAAAGAATGAATNKDNRLMGAIYGGIGGYGAGQLGASADAAGGVSALFTKDGWAKFVGSGATPADAKAGTPAGAATGLGGTKGGLESLMAAATPYLAGSGGASGSGGDDKNQYREPYVHKDLYGKGEWVYDERGMPQWVLTPKGAAGGLVQGYAKGGVSSDDAYDYLFGGDLPVGDPTPARTLERASVRPPKAATTTPSTEIELPPLGVVDGGGSGISGPTSGQDAGPGVGGPGTAGGTTGGEAGAIGQGPGSVTSNAPTAGQIGNVAGVVGGIASGVPGLGSISNMSGFSQTVADAIAAQEGQNNQNSVAAVSPPGMSPEGLANAVDSAPVSGEAQGTAAATAGPSGTGGAAASASAAAAAAAAAAGMGDAAQGAAGQAAADAAIGGADAAAAAAAGAAAASAAQGAATAEGNAVGADASVGVDGPSSADAAAVGDSTDGVGASTDAGPGVGDGSEGSADGSAAGSADGSVGDGSAGSVGSGGGAEGTGSSSDGGGGGGGGGGCYVTEAITRAGKSDDAVELGVMRDFRDNVMLKNPEMAPLVQKYYELAPRVVEALNGREDADEIYGLLRERFLKPGVEQVMAGDNKAALKTYSDMLAFVGPLAKTKAGTKLAAGAEQVSGSLRGGGLVALQSGGFVFPADVVSAVGAGSSSAGLEALAKKFGAKPVQGKGHGQSDDVPAMIDGRSPARVARDEAVLDAAQVARIGGGDPKKGAKKLYDMMSKVRKRSMGTTRQMRPVSMKELA